MSAADILISLANIIYAGALLVRGMLWLRLLILLSAAFFVAWGLVREEYVYVGWTALFVSINCWRIVTLLRDRRPILLNPDQSRLHSGVFSDLSKRAFLNLWNFGEERRFRPGEQVIAQGSRPEHLMVVLEGETRVEIDGREVARLGDGRFVGEMSFLTGSPASADVVAEAPLRVMAWSQPRLHDLRELDPALSASLGHVLGRDLSLKTSASSRG